MTKKAEIFGLLLQFMNLNTGGENLQFQGAAEVSNTEWELISETQAEVLELP